MRENSKLELDQWKVVGYASKDGGVSDLASGSGKVEKTLESSAKRYRSREFKGIVLWNF